MAPETPPASSFVLPLPSLAALGGAPLYLTNEDALLLTVFNAATGVVVTLAGRTLDFGDKHPKPFKRTLTPTTNRAASTLNLNLGEGWLLGAQVIVTSGTPLTGQTYARLSLVRGLTSVADESFTLASDTITVGKALAWPGGPMCAPLDGAGTIRSIAGAVPAAGAEISETVPTGARWELISLKATFVTSAAVANRVPGLQLDDGTTAFWRIEATNNQTATQTRQQCWSAGYGAAILGSGNINNYGLPIGNKLGAGFRIRTNTASIDGADQYSAVQYLVREWLEV